MPDAKLIARLREGVEGFNSWRWHEPRAAIDLMDTDLHGLDLKGAQLQFAKLDGANCSGADLRKASLIGASAVGARFDEAKLAESTLTQADFSRASLVKTDAARVSGMSSKFIRADLTQAFLSGAVLSFADFSGARLARADISAADFDRAALDGACAQEAYAVNARFPQAFLNEADFSGANCVGAQFPQAELKGAVFAGGSLFAANLTETNLTGADLRNVILERARLVRTCLDGAQLEGCRVYGIATWDVSLAGAQQNALVITPTELPTITVDHLEVAQFVYLLLNNERIREVIDTITSKAVLILGRFTPERKAVLDALRDHLRRKGYLPILFDFEKPATRNLTETVSTLGHLSRFVIADLSAARSIPQEIERLVPRLPSVVFRPLIAADDEPWAMWEDFQVYPWVLEPYRYASQAALLDALEEWVIAPAEQRLAELSAQRAKMSRGVQ